MYYLGLGCGKLLEIAYDHSNSEKEIGGLLKKTIKTSLTKTDNSVKFLPNIETN